MKTSLGRLKVPLFHLQYADSEDEVSESDETIEEPLAIGNDSEQDDSVEVKETSATLHKDIASTSSGSGRDEKCRPTTFQTVGALQMRCQLSGGVINESRTKLAELNTSITNLPGIERPLFSVVTTSCPERLLPSLPSTSLEDSSPEQDGGSRSSHQSGSLVTGRANEEKTPVQSKLEEFKFALVCSLSLKVAMLTLTRKSVFVFYIAEILVLLRSPHYPLF